MLRLMPGWIEPVIAQMENDERIAVAAPKIKSFDNKGYFEHAGAAGGFIDKYGYPFCRGRIFYEIEADRANTSSLARFFGHRVRQCSLKRNVGTWQADLTKAFLPTWKKLIFAGD
jgi:GT2 family glycosyltransferase